jgi:hypothetical protein
MSQAQPNTQTETTPGPTVMEGYVTALRLFDLAYAIDLGQAESLWARQARQGARSKLTGTPPKAVDFGDPPLGLFMAPLPLVLVEDGVRVNIEAAVVARSMPSAW